MSRGNVSIDNGRGNKNRAKLRYVEKQKRNAAKRRNRKKWKKWV